MADDRLLSAWLSKMHPRHNVPHLSIITCTLLVSGMVFWEFGDLLIIDVTLYGAALFLEFLASIVLRIRQPDAHRPFEVPLNVAGLVAMTALPVFCLFVALTAALSEIGAYTNATLFAIGAVATAPVAWYVLSSRRRMVSHSRGSSPPDSAQ